MEGGSLKPRDPWSPQKLKEGRYSLRASQKTSPADTLILDSGLQSVSICDVLSNHRTLIRMVYTDWHPRDRCLNLPLSLVWSTERPSSPGRNLFPQPSEPPFLPGASKDTSQRFPDLLWMSPLLPAHPCLHPLGAATKAPASFIAGHSGGWKSKIKSPAGSVPGEVRLPGS